MEQLTIKLDRIYDSYNLATHDRKSYKIQWLSTLKKADGYTMYKKGRMVFMA